MTDTMTFRGSLGHVKFIQGRKVAQFIVEVPTELAMEALKNIGGVPRADQPFDVAVARIVDPLAIPENLRRKQTTPTGERQ